MVVSEEGYGCPEFSLPVSSGLAVEAGDFDIEEAQQGSQIAEFPIGPGQRLQLLRLKADNTSNEHYYVNVFGRAINKEACPHCEYTEADKHEDLLTGRPNHYTPFYVPRYDEQATLELKLERNKLRVEEAAAQEDGAAPPDDEDKLGKVTAQYDWMLRPEYQFTLLDIERLNLLAVDIQTDIFGGEREALRRLFDPGNAYVADEDDLIRALFDLILPNDQRLEGLDSPQEYVFAFGEEEVLITAGVNRFEIKNLDHLASLDWGDILTARLFLNSDPDNLLWQFAFGTVYAAVDLDRNGCLEFRKDDATRVEYSHCDNVYYMNDLIGDHTSPEQPFRFWVNNDYDVVNNNGTPHPEYSVCREVPPPDNPNPSIATEQICEQWDETPDSGNSRSNTAPIRLSRIESRRDLEDFFPIAIKLNGPTDELSENYYLEITASGVSVNLFKGAWSDLYGAKAYSYVLDEAGNERQEALASEEGGYVGQIRDGRKLTLNMQRIKADKIFDYQGVGRFIAEGVSECESEPEECFIKVEAFSDIEGQVVSLGKSKVWLDLKDVKSFYDHYTAGNVDKDSFTLEDFSPTTPHAIRENRDGFPERMDIYEGVTDEEIIQRNYVLFVHGWRMEYPEKVSFAETAFKRLYWSGYQGRFGMLTWPTGYFDKPAHFYSPLILIPGYLSGNEQNYGDSEAVARQTGALMADWLEQKFRSEYQNGLHVVAHSMGNVVVSEALKHAPSAGIIDSYTPSQAATAAEAYYSNVELVDHLVVGSDVLGGSNIQSSPELAWGFYNSPPFNGKAPYPPTRFDMPPDFYRLEYDLTKHGPTDDILLNNKFLHDQAVEDDGINLRLYYSGMAGKAKRVVNNYNVRDAALTAWEFNQLTKPDYLGGAEWDYRNEMYECYSGASSDTEEEDCRETIKFVSSRFYRAGVELTWEPSLEISTSSNNADILGHIIPARSDALGQVSQAQLHQVADRSSVSLIDESIDLGYNAGNQGHSAQFYSAFPNRSSYWGGILSRSLALKGGDYSAISPDYEEPAL